MNAVANRKTKFNGFSVEERQAICEQFRSWKVEGKSKRAFCREVDITTRTLNIWLRDYGYDDLVGQKPKQLLDCKQGPSPKLKPIQVVPNSKVEVPHIHTAADIVEVKESFALELHTRGLDLFFRELPPVEWVVGLLEGGE